MKKIFIILVCVLILSLSVIQVTPVNAQPLNFSVTQVYWGSNTSTMQAKPGDKNAPLNVVIRNIDTEGMSSVTAKLYLTGSPFTTPTGESTAFAGALSIVAGQSQTFTFTLNIDPSAELKTYRLTMDLTSITAKYASGITSTVTIPVQLRGEVRFSTFITPQTIQPGSNDVTLNIVNDGQASASNVGVTVTAPIALVIVEKDSSWFFDEVKPLETLRVNVKLYAPSTSTGNAYTLSVGLSFVDGYGFAGVETLTAGVIVENPVVKPIMSIAIDKVEIAAGTTDSLKFTVSNGGQIDAQDVNIAFSLPASSSLTQATATSPIILVRGDGFWHFDRVKAGSHETFTADLTTDKNVVGTYQITLTLNYLDSRDQRYSETRKIGLSVTPKSPSSILNIESYNIHPNIVRKGENFTLTLTVKNYGNFEAQKATVQLIPPPLFATTSPSLITIGDLPPNEMKQVKYDLAVSPSAQAGVIQPFEVDITFTDSLGVTGVSSSSIGIPLHGTVDLIIYDVSTIPAPAEVGRQFALSLVVLNRGTVSAMYTNVSILSEFPFTQTLGGYPYIGELDVSAPAPVSLSATISSETEEGVYPLKLAIYYQDEYNLPHMIVKEIRIPVAHPSATEEVVAPAPNYTQYILLGAIIVVAAVAGLTVFMMRRRKRVGE